MWRDLPSPSDNALATGVDKGGQVAQPPNGRTKKNLKKIEGLVEPVVLNLSFGVRSNAIYTSEIRY